MRSPSDHQIIQIDITNACPHKCSSCTRFTSHVRNPFFMDMDTFQQAVGSMEGYQGLLGIMGGEPTLHPDFEQLVDWYADNWGRKTRAINGRFPIVDFNAYAADRLFDQSSRRGLWTSLGPGYYQHFELIQEVFDYQCVNTHENPGLHQSLLITRKELGISDAEWLQRRDACWVQNMWSSAITPKGAFFCEVAAALDMLYDGPGGWPIEPGWWKRTPAEFGEQLRWCELCAAPLDVPRIPANQEIDVVSPGHIAKLQAIDSPSLRQNRVRVFDVSEYRPELWQCKPKIDWYLEGTGNARVPATHHTLHMRRLDGVVVCVDYGDFLERTLPHNVGHFDRLVVVTASHDVATQETARRHGATLVVSDRCYENGDAFNKGRMLNDGLAVLSDPDWVLFTDADILLPRSLRADLNGVILNPGCLHCTTRFGLPLADESTLRMCLEQPEDARRLCESDGDVDDLPCGFFQLWNVRARAVRQRWPKVLYESFPSAGSIDTWFHDLWPRDKWVRLFPSRPDFQAFHLPHGSYAQNWNGRLSRSTGVWRHGGWLTGLGLRIVDPWPERCQLRVIGGDAEVLLDPATLARVARFDERGLIWNDRVLGNVLLTVAWRPLEEERSPPDTFGGSIVAWHGGVSGFVAE